MEGRGGRDNIGSRFNCVPNLSTGCLGLGCPKSEDMCLCNDPRLPEQTVVNEICCMTQRPVVILNLCLDKSRSSTTFHMFSNQTGSHANSYHPY